MASIRKDALENNHIYHVFVRSISKYIVFNDDSEYSRIIKLMSLCRFKDFNKKFSDLVKLSNDAQTAYVKNLKSNNKTYVEIIAYCIMPTHIHLILKQTSENGISKYMGKLLNSYAKYFNTKHQRSGPLWASRFKNVLIIDDEQLLHLTRYIHLNPTSAKLSQKPEDWQFSSYSEYLDSKGAQNIICNYSDIIEIDPRDYRKFVNDRKSYQQEISLIKKLLIDDYSG